MSGTNNSKELNNSSLPASITFSTFAAARIKEVQSMRKSILESNGGTKMVFQKLPKHMRRRAMSHVVKRLPRRLREIHLSQMKKSGLPPKSKRPSRRYRRRLRNLQSDYIRRQRRVKWLDTHIWHAKRFHMVEKWGYKLPKQPCDKSFRACYRATIKHCLLQDISYMRPIEISGDYSDIIVQLNKLCNPKVGLTFGAKCYSEGRKYGEITIFEPNCNSENHNVIGDVTFLWSTLCNSRKLLCLFVHPAFYKQLLQILVTLFEFKPTETKESNIEIYSNTQSSVTLRELEFELGMFRLTGPSSTAVLKKALKPIDMENPNKTWPDWFNIKQFPKETVLEQNKAFNELENTAYFPPNMVLSLIVRDPRLVWPKKRTKAVLDKDNLDNDNFDTFQRNLSFSLLFEDDVRESGKKEQISTAQICEMRRNLLVPGSHLEMDKESVIPIILLWRCGNKNVENNGYSSGWDIILPINWARSFFLSFIIWGARAGGLRETESIAFEKSQPDILFPDTIAGQLEEEYTKKLNTDTFFRLPPNKRTNFNKFSISCPLNFNWRLLLSEWSNGASTEQFFVLRDKNLLRKIKDFFGSTKSQMVLPQLPNNCLIPVKVVPLKKGACAPFGIICLPSMETDLKSEPVEPQSKDINEAKRKSLRREHLALLKRLRQKRKRSVKLGKPVTPTDADLLRNYTKEMRNLWLPEAVKIRNSCSREIIGFIKHGAYSFAIGQSKGLGYIVANSVEILSKFSQNRNKILIRNTNSRHYKLAMLDVIIS